MIKTYILGNEDHVQRKAVFWNMVASTLSAALSVVLLLIVTRTLGVVEAGVFSLAYSISQMFLTVGLFDMRTYQATDVNGSSKFKYYYTSRIITCIAMLMTACVYVLFKGYTGYKLLVVMLLCLLKMFDAFEDVFFGLFQQKGRLDIAGKLQSLRLLLVIIGFTVSLLITKNLVFSIALTIGVSLIVVFTELLPITKLFTKIELGLDRKQLIHIFLACFPLFIGSYLSIYIENSPKYAIDQLLQPEFQTYYNVLFMPSYVISLFSSFAFRPLLTPMAVAWSNKDVHLFTSYIKKLCLLIVAFTSITLIGAYMLGIPVLSFLYAADLAPYKNVLLLLILGGGINTIGTAVYYAITVMRYQKSLLYGYGISAIMALTSTPVMVERFGLQGGAMVFILLISVRVMCFIVTFLYGFRKEKKKGNL